MVELDKVFNQVINDKIRTIPEKTRIVETARKKGRLLAVRGDYDYVEEVLPYCYAADKVLLNSRDSPPNLQEFDVVFVGCPGKLMLSKWKGPLDSFLCQGGILLTTDWCLENLIQPVFPGTIRKAGTAQGSFPLRVRQPGHPLLEGIKKCEGTAWTVEAASHRIRVEDEKRVTVILDAPTMGEPANVLVAFPVGKGLVVHAISHFHLQGSDDTAEYVSAYVVTNVIDEAVRRRYPQETPRVRVLPNDKQSQPLRIRLTKRRR